MSTTLPPLVSPQEAQKRVAAGALLIDVREPDEWQKMHVAASTLIPLGDVSSRLDEIPKDRDVILICRSGRRSGAAQTTLKGRGYDRVANLDGGLIAWHEGGLPVVEES